MTDYMAIEKGINSELTNKPVKCKAEVYDGYGKVYKEFDGIIKEVKIKDGNVRFVVSIIPGVYQGSYENGRDVVYIACAAIKNKTIIFINDDDLKIYEKYNEKMIDSKKSNYNDLENINKIMKTLKEQSLKEQNSKKEVADVEDNNPVQQHITNKKRVTQESLIQIKNDLPTTFSSFQDYSEVSSFVNRKHGGFVYSKNECENIYRKAIAELNSLINDSYNKIVNEINAYIEIINDASFGDGKSYTSDGLVESVAIAAGIGWGAAILLSGPVGWIVGTFAGIAALYKSNENKENLIRRILSDAKDMNAKAIEKIGEILDKIILPEQVDFKPVERKIENEYRYSLTKEQLEIKKYLEKRGIKYLVHFSNYYNNGSIMKNGILSSCEAKRRNINIKINDNNISSHKADYYMSSSNDDYISLSITNVNKDVLAAYKYSGRLKKVIIYYIDASILWKEIDKDRVYCNMNASASWVKCGKGIEGLNRMFADVVNQYGYDPFTRDGKNDNETTHPQAEILFEKCIDPKYIYSESDIISMESEVF